MSESEEAMSEVVKEEARESDLVVVGSSAGGIEAVSILVSTLPKDFPAPIVLAQHLDPTRASSLDMILRQRSTLPVELVTSKSLLEPGKVYVVPSNRLVSIVDGHVEVQEGNFSRTRARPSVDMLFSSAARVYGDRLIAVILTGSGSDGAAGAVDVKNAGGTVIVQDPQTARYPSMPLALPPSVIDCEAELEQIGPLLYDLLAGGALPPTEDKTEDVLRFILAQVSRQANLDFRPYKTSTILRRIGRRMAVTHMRNMREYLEYLKAQPEEVGELVKAFLINVTQFFRDADAFAYLKSDILPRLITQSRERNRVLRVWTAGCATGEEPYSLAMLLTDLLGTELPEWSVKVFATDLSETAINFARRGLYSESVLKGIPDDYRERFFEQADHGYRIGKILRQMVIFGQQDLARNAPFPRIDLLLCRNVLIYFTPELQEYVLNQFAFSLSPGGYLFLGKAETVRPTQTHFELVNKHWKLYQAIGSAIPLGRQQHPSEQRLPRLDRNSLQRLQTSTGKQALEQDATGTTIEIGQLRRLNELLLRFLPTGIVVIDRSYQVLTANGTARRLLGLRDVASGQDFLHSVHGIPYNLVRNAIDNVFRERSSVTLPEVAFDPMSGGNHRFVSLSMALMQLDSGLPDLVVMTVTEVTEQLQVRRQLETAQSEQSRLVNELSLANKRLNEVNKELLDANEELQVSNEELMLTHEELQASIEEFETTNEELQATNEELETTNDELRVRTGELQEMTTMLENEGGRLSEMVELAPFSILVLRGPHLLVTAYNPRYTPLVEAKIVQDRPLDEVFEHFWLAGEPLVRMAVEVYQGGQSLTTSPMLAHVFKDDVPAERYLVFTLVPSHDSTGHVSGVIVYAIDETERLIKEAEEERERLRLIIENASEMALALYDARTGELLTGSPLYLDMLKTALRLDYSQLIGEHWQNLTPFIPREEALNLWNTSVESRAPVRLPEIRVQSGTDEQETIWNWTLTPILKREEPDGVQYLLVTAVETTEQTLAREVIEELNRLKDDFLSLASHELRTPLTSIRGNAELLQRRLQRQMPVEGQQAEQRAVNTQEGSARDVQTLAQIIHQANRLNRLIEELVDITRIHGGVLEFHNQENVNIVELVRRVVDYSSAVAERPITLKTDADVLSGNWDEARLEQVLNNLLSNALKYSPSGTPVAVTIEHEPGKVVIKVQDEGEGMSEEDVTHIFDRFYRTLRAKGTRIEGLGLGLYIAQEIIAQYGGRIEVESKRGKGSTFSLSLSLDNTITEGL